MRGARRDLTGLFGSQIASLALSRYGYGPLVRFAITQIERFAMAATSQLPDHQQVLDSTARTEAEMSVQRVPVNVYETPSAMVVVAPLPAVTAEDVTIKLGRRQLRFTAGLRSAGPRDYVVQEWEYGGYEREIEIPDGYGGGVEASLANGQLAVRVLRGDFIGPLEVHPVTTRLLDDLPSG